MKSQGQPTDCGRCLERCEESGEEPDHGSCPMPQELRWPEFRTAKADEIIVKSIKAHNYLSSPSIINRGLQDIAIQASWPEMNCLEADLFLIGLVEQDSMTQEKVTEKED